MDPNTPFRGMLDCNLLRALIKILFLLVPEIPKEMTVEIHEMSLDFIRQM